MRIEDRDERDFYENEAIRSNWNVNTLKRQFHSSLYERLALSRDKNDVMRLANEGAVPQKPQDILHMPYVLEFAGLEDKASYHESDLESAVIEKLRCYPLKTVNRKMNGLLVNSFCTFPMKCLTSRGSRLFNCFYKCLERCSQIILI